MCNVCRGVSSTSECSVQAAESKFSNKINCTFTCNQSSYVLLVLLSAACLDLSLYEELITL